MNISVKVQTPKEIKSDKNVLSKTEAIISTPEGNRAGCLRYLLVPKADCLRYHLVSRAACPRSNLVSKAA